MNLSNACHFGAIPNGSRLSVLPFNLELKFVTNYERNHPPRRPFQVAVDTGGEIVAAGTRGEEFNVYVWSIQTGQTCARCFLSDLDI